MALEEVQACRLLFRFVAKHSGEKLGRLLAEAGIFTVLTYAKALPFYPAYGHLGHTPKDFPIAHANRSRILSLPIYPEITDDMISYLAGKIAEFSRGSPQLNRGFVNPTMSRRAEWIG